MGGDKCPIVDTYWQTETGAHVLAPLPGVWPAKPGSATLPFFGVQPAMVNEQVSSSASYLEILLLHHELAFFGCMMNRYCLAASQNMKHGPELCLHMASEAPYLLGKVMGSVALNRYATMLCSNKEHLNVVSSSDILCDLMPGSTY